MSFIKSSALSSCLFATMFAGSFCLSSPGVTQIVNEHARQEVNLAAPTLNLPVLKVSGRAALSLAQSRALIKKATPQQLGRVEAVIRPRMLRLLQDQSAKEPTGSLLNWREIIQGGKANKPVVGSTESTANTSVVKPTFSFTNRSGASLLARPAMREFHRNPAVKDGAQRALFGEPGRGFSAFASVDLDQDGLPDDLESQVADNFTPIYAISAGEQQQFATFGDYVPMTVTSLVGTAPPLSYFRVQPLGIGTTAAGVQMYALRIDYLSLWNADGGLVGGGGACLYSYVGLDGAVQALSGHDLDAERSAMLVAAPVVNGGYNPDPNAYTLYTLYMGAHENTFFDQSAYADFNPSIAAGNHVHLAQSVSKHSTYNFNPDYFPITPGYFIAATNASFDAAYADGDIDEATYALSIAIANDVFYGCLVERFSDQGGSFASPRINVGEPSYPINGSTFIQDDSSRALNLTDKLNTPLF